MPNDIFSIDESNVIGKDYFVYTFFLASIAPGASAIPLSVTVQNDSHFLWQKMSYFCTSNDANVISTVASFACLPAIAMQITDTSSGRIQFSRSTALPSVAGNGQFPFILPETRLFQPKTTITLELSNYHATETYENIFINLIGTKVFTKSN